jgi:hypothetical protein
MKTLTKESSKKKSSKKAGKKSSKKSRKEEMPTFPLRAPRMPWWAKIDRGTKPIKYITKKNGELETKEERKKRLAKREALFRRALQAAYDDHHKQ